MNNIYLLIPAFTDTTKVVIVYGTLSRSRIEASKLGLYIYRIYAGSWTAVDGPCGVGDYQIQTLPQGY